MYIKKFRQTTLVFTIFLRGKKYTFDPSQIIILFDIYIVDFFFHRSIFN